MTLDEYLTAKKIKSSTFAKLIGSSVFAVNKWRQGTRIPRPHLAIEIEKITKKKVGIADLTRAYRGGAIDGGLDRG